MTAGGALIAVLTLVFVGTQLLYTLALGIDLYFYTRRVHWVRPDDIAAYNPVRYPMIVLLYPVLRELEETMATTLLGLSKLDYPEDRFRIVAIPNDNDHETLERLRRLQDRFAFLEVLPVPPTSDESWNAVWESWSANPKAYWWHWGAKAANHDLPPKKTRQLVYALYTIAAQMSEEPDWLLNYIDADSVPPVDHLRAGAAGSERFDVLQATNVAGNLLDSWAASWHAMDHMSWDGLKYPRMTSPGRQPYWMLGKGLFYKASDLLELGSFNPWVTIEDPEVGLRLWANGKRLGLIAAPLIEEVPTTIRAGVTQRKRWVCGFLQASAAPLVLMGLTAGERARARMNLWPFLFLAVNPVGIPIGIWAFVVFVDGTSPLPLWVGILCIVNIAALVTSLTITYVSTGKRTGYVLDRRADRIRYMLRVNPLLLIVYWLIWIVPIAIGIQMFVRDRGLVWERTEKIDANHRLVRGLVADGRTVEQFADLDLGAESELEQIAPVGRRVAARESVGPGRASDSS